MSVIMGVCPNWSVVLHDAPASSSAHTYTIVSLVVLRIATWWKGASRPRTLKLWIEICLVRIFLLRLETCSLHPEIVMVVQLH